jgi:hypothetical protein
MDRLKTLWPIPLTALAAVLMGLATWNTHRFPGFVAGLVVMAIIFAVFFWNRWRRNAKRS